MIYQDNWEILSVQAFVQKVCYPAVTLEKNLKRLSEETLMADLNFYLTQAGNSKLYQKWTKAGVPVCEKRSLVASTN